MTDTHTTLTFMKNNVVVAFVLAAVSAFGCASNSQLPSTEGVISPSATQDIVAKGREDPRTKLPFKLADSEWKLEKIRLGTTEKPQLNAVYSSVDKAGIRASAFVATAKLSPTQETTFVDSMRARAHERDDAEIVGETDITLKGGIAAYEILDARQEPGGRAAVATVVAAHEGVGYVASCGGNLEEVEFFLVRCLSLIESLEPRK